MDRYRKKKHTAYSSLNQFFRDFGDGLAAAYPIIGTARATFILKYKAMIKPIENIDSFSKLHTGRKKQLKAACLESIWKLVSAMRYHYTFTNDKARADMVSISYATLSALSEAKFFVFCQSVMNYYDPDIYDAFGIEEAKMDDLKLKLADYPNKIRASADARVIRKNAVLELIDKQRDMDFFLKNGVTPLLEVAGDEFLNEKIQYRLAIRVGRRGKTSGKPHKKAKLAAGETMVLDKSKFRNKLCIIVKNKGETSLIAGRSTNNKELQGTPFAIEPGKIRVRISQKLGSTGEYILIRNVGVKEGSFEVWLKETN